MNSPKWPAIALLAVCEVFVMGLWFSASAIIVSYRAEFGLSDFAASLITSSVAIGYVTGTLASAVLGLADRLDPRRFFMLAALVAAGANAAILLAGPHMFVVAALRFVVGGCMAGVYPIGMKLAATWADRDIGLLVGILVGALTLGSASPHLIAAFGGVDWRFTLVVASALAATAAGLINFMRVGPHVGTAPPFQPGYVLQAWRQRSLRLANLGYFGHMWELYAMWTWIGLFLRESFALNPGGDGVVLHARIVTFATVGVGAFGSLLGGMCADRFGRTTLTMGAMALSGACALVIGWLFGGPPLLVTALCLVWGVAVVADSAQFSAGIIELSDPSHVGTMLTVQTCVGFLLTTITIHLIPPLSHALSWRYVFAVLAVGPFLGVWAMGALRAHPDAVKLAGGNR